MRQKCDNKSMIILCEYDCRPCLNADKVHAVPSANIPPGDPVHLVIAGSEQGKIMAILLSIIVKFRGFPKKTRDTYYFC